MKNKKSLWSNLILIIAIIMLVSIVISIVNLIVQLPAAREAAMQEAMAAGYSESVAEVAVDAVIGGVVAGFVLGLTFNAFEVIGGFLFSLKGKWGMFCVVIAAISLGFCTIRVFTNIGNGSDALTIILNIVDVILAAIFLVASIMHRKENKELALQAEQAE